MQERRRTFQWPWKAKDQIRTEVDEEIQFHLEMRTQELVDQGLSLRGAREQATREFGDSEEARRALVSMDVRMENNRRRLEWVREFQQDVAFAVRTWRLNPGFASVILLTLALGVGVNTSIFSIVNGVLFRPLPFPEEARLVAVWPEKGLQKAEYELLKRTSRHYQSVSLYQAAVGFSLVAQGEAERLTGAYVSGDFFNTLGISPLLGRGLLTGDQFPGASPVVVLSERLWLRRFGGRSDLLLSQIELDGVSRTVVGVMPAEFSFPQWGTELWAPLTIDPAEGGDFWGNWGGYCLARLKPQSSPEQAQAELRTLAGEMRLQNPLWTPLADFGRNATVVQLRREIVGEARPLLMLLLGAVLFVLLVACANVGNLMLSKGLARDREWALRGALGASRGRLIRQILTEGSVLGLGAGILGFWMAWLGQNGLRRWLPADLPRGQEISIDYGVFLFALLAALTTGLLASLIPALRMGKLDLGSRLINGGRSGSGSSHRGLSRSLVAVEIALAVILVSCASLLSQSFLNLWQTDTGFRRQGVTRAVISPPSSKYQSPQKQKAFYAELVTRMRTIPGLDAVAVSSQVPFDNRVQRSAIFIEGVTEDPNVLPMFDTHQVSPEYFQVMGIPLLKGRSFAQSDREGAPLVAIIDERAAQMFWHGEDPLGSYLGRPWLAERIPIVGVVGSVRNKSLSGEEFPGLYLSFLQSSNVEARLVIRSEMDPDKLASRIRTAVSETDPEVPVSRIQTNLEAIEATLGKPGLAAFLLLGFSLLALLLGGIGIYGIIAYSVRRRTAEIGVRMALGANSRDVTRLILKEGFGVSGIGLISGVLGALALTPLLEGLLYGVEGNDPLSLLQGPFLLALISLLACYLPARKAVRVNPLEALRQE